MASRVIDGLWILDRLSGSLFHRDQVFVDVSCHSAFPWVAHFAFAIKPQILSCRHVGPHSNVPPEILTEIFEQLYLLSLGPPDSSFEHGRRIRKLCWPVSQVCKYWREVALVVPLLWTYLPLINLDDKKPPSPGEHLECMKTLIPRCRDAAFHVSLVCAPDAKFDHNQEVHCYLHDRAEQWRSLAICAATQDIELILNDIVGRVPHLEELRIDFVDGEDIGGALQMFGVAPMLRSVYLSGAANEWYLTLDTRSLVHFHDEMGALMHNIEPSRGFSLLTTLEFHDRGLFEYEALSQELEENSITFPSLKTLKYYCHDTFSVEDGFLQFAITPALEELAVDAGIGDVIYCLLELHERTEFIPLKVLRLKVEMDECIESDFTELLRCLPGLEVLDTDLPSMDIALLSVVEGPEVLLPRLRKCSFRYHEDNFDGIHLDITQLASARCEHSWRTDAPADETRAALMELYFKMDIFMDPRTRAGFGHDQYQYLGMQPTRLEPWYGERHPFDRWEKSDIPRSAYTEAEATIPAMVLQGLGTIEKSSHDYQHTLELLTRVEEKYKPTQLVDFLETNMNICLIALAYVLKTQFPNMKKKNGRMTLYERIIRLLKEVKTDLMERLDDFHWIWETTPETYSIRYIPDQHEIRADRDKFANAVLGLSDDQWLLDDF